MLGNPIRVAWADQLWREVLADPQFAHHFTWLRGKAEDACVTIGYPPTKARGKRGERLGACVEFNWKGSESEKALVSIHPETLGKPADAVKAVTAAALKSVLGTRQANRALRYEHRAMDAMAARVLERIGEPPAGYAEMAEPKSKAGSRLRLYVCKQNCYRVRAASDTFDATCNLCGGRFVKQ